MKFIAVDNLPTKTRSIAAKKVQEFIDSGMLIAKVELEGTETVKRVKANLYEAARKTNGLVSVYATGGEVFLTHNAPEMVEAKAE
jgi:hypothetical protein